MDFAREEMASLGFMFRGRSAVWAFIAIWLLVTLPAERSAIYVGVIVAFFLLGAIPYWLAMQGVARTWIFAAFLLMDAGALSYLLIVPNPYGLEGWSPQMNLRVPGFLYLGVFLAYMSLSYRPALVIWAGVAAVATWSIGHFWVLSLPETRFFSSRDVIDAGLSLDDALERILDPNAVGFARWVNQTIFLVAVTLILTLAASRSRQLVRRRLEAEGQRAALSRYFSPNIVRQLSENREALDQPKVQSVAVLFADMVGFTAISEKLEPNELVRLLREFHGRLVRTALKHGGTVDKFIGDAIMVHFGTPSPSADDAVRACNGPRK